MRSLKKAVGMHFRLLPVSTLDATRPGGTSTCCRSAQYWNISANGQRSRRFEQKRPLSMNDLHDVPSLSPRAGPCAGPWDATADHCGELS